jgi:CubicO group peptidase (beta-lactamase class C family)
MATASCMDPAAAILITRASFIFQDSTINRCARRASRSTNFRSDAEGPDQIRTVNIRPRDPLVEVTAPPHCFRAQPPRNDVIIGHCGLHVPTDAVVQDGRTVYAEGFGVTTAGGSDAVTPQTCFMIGSSTKPLTTLMMARLVDMGRFTWTTPAITSRPMNPWRATTESM